ncbi:hypothetical protein AwDysgo_18540 [Bacteroidales bacterium]|nr:hypothetical protein AwDysgo_18540 [Bacteroidales bacterium]
MNKLTWLFLSVLISLNVFSSAFSQKYAAGNALSIIDGTFTRAGYAGDVTLYEITLGDMHKIASSAIDKKKNFSFAFKPEKEAFYVIGLDLMPSMLHKYMFYFKPGDILNIQINDSSFTLAGKNTEENKALEKWHDLILPLEVMSLYRTNNTYVNYFPVLEDKLPEIESFKAETSNKVFNEAFALKRRSDVYYYSFSLIMSMRSTHPQGDDYPDYYREMDLREEGKTSIFMNYPMGMQLLSMCEYVNMLFAKNASGDEDSKPVIKMPSLDSRLSVIADPLTQGEMVTKEAASIKSSVGFETFLPKYSSYLIDPTQKDRVGKLSSALANIVGEKAADFTFKDMEGKDVSLSDFVGKVVYVDVWATWCGPCKKEIPYMKELEKKYHGKNIEFIAISVDVAKDEQKWKDYVKKENLPGVQLIVGEETKKFREDYKVKGIPHFVLVGKDGALIMNNAPRPSSEEIFSMIDKALE